MAKIEDVNAKLDYLEITKELIKTAIENKGQEIEETDTFREFVNKISNIRTKSNFITSGISISSNARVGDTFQFQYPIGEYKLGDFTYCKINKDKNINANNSMGYIYSLGIIEITNVEPYSEIKELVTLKLIYIFNYTYPEFINSNVNETGIKYGNEVTSSSYNWYSYDYSNLDVQSQDVLVNKKFQGPSGIESGSMPSNGQLNYTPSNTAQTIPAGYTSGGTISAMDITTSTAYLNSLALTKQILGIE